MQQHSPKQTESKQKEIQTSGNEKRLRFVEVNAANGTVVLVESVNEGAHAVIPELDHAAVETGEDPWPLAVKAQSFHSIALGLEFRQHFLQILSPPMIGRGNGMERSELVPKFPNPDGDLDL